MGLTRRNVLKATGLGAAAVIMNGCAISNSSKIVKNSPIVTKLMSPPQGNRVVIVGGGFGGLAMAKEICENNKNAQVVVLEKRDIFMSFPFSNAHLGELEGVNLDTLIRDYYAPAKEYGYTFIQCEVTAIDRKSKTISTTAGQVEYDILALAPGVAYDYEKQFPKWSQEKIQKVSQNAPGALISESEYLLLKKKLSSLDSGNVIITVPSGKYRCLSAPYERACMIAHYMNKKDIKGKVIILDTASKPRVKSAAFMEAFMELYEDRIEFIGNVNIVDVDLDNKTIHYTTKDKNLDETKHDTTYEVLNLIPFNKASPVIKMAGISTNSWGGAKLKGAGFTSVDDADVYVVGDALGHEISPSAQMASWAGKRAGQHIAKRLLGEEVEDTEGLPDKNAALCYSMVGNKPEEAVMTACDISFANGVLSEKSSISKDKMSGKFRSIDMAKANREWYRKIMSEIFAV